MFSRIAVIFLITGLGQLCSVFVLKYLVRYSSIDQTTEIVEIETTVQLVVSLIAFGLQSSAIRDLSMLHDWRDEFNKIQSARFTFGFFLMIICALSLYDSQYVYFSIAPLLALNADYALYARGYPITGALVACGKVVIPLLFSAIAVFYMPTSIASMYFLGVILSFFITGLIISRVLKTDFLVWPKIDSLLLYLKTIPLGIISLSLYFFGLGILFLADYIIADSEMTVAFLALKFYLIYKGVLRVLHQAFIKDMINDQMCSHLDHLSFMIGLLYFGSVVVFPKTFISFFFGEQFIEYELFFELVSFSALVYSLFLSMTTRALLDRADRKYFKLAIASVLMSVACLFALNLFSKSINVLGLSLVAGEVMFSFGLGFLFLKRSQILSRSWFNIKAISFIGIPVLFRVLQGDTFFNYVLSFSIMGVLMLVVGYSMIKTVILTRWV